MQGRFGSLITAMATPFDNDGKVDLGAAAELAVWLIDNGSDGVVVAGSTGEAPTLSDKEKASLWKAVVEAVGGKGSVIAGTGTYDTAHTITLNAQAEKAGVNGLLVVTPYYNRPPQAGLLAHFSAVAEATDMPIILYDVPIRTGRKIEHETIIELAKIPNVVAVKDAAGDVQAAARLVADSPEGFHVYCGNDADTLPWLSVGSVGVIAVASHVVGPQMAEMISLFESDPAAARKIHLDLMPVFDAMGITSNPIPVKAALELIGKKVGAPRLPLVAATATESDSIRTALAKAGVI